MTSDSERAFSVWCSYYTCGVVTTRADRLCLVVRGASEFNKQLMSQWRALLAADFLTPKTCSIWSTSQLIKSISIRLPAVARRTWVVLKIRWCKVMNECALNYKLGQTVSSKSRLAFIYLDYNWKSLANKILVRMLDHTIDLHLTTNGYMNWFIKMRGKESKSASTAYSVA